MPRRTLARAVARATPAKAVALLGVAAATATMLAVTAASGAVTGTAPLDPPLGACTGGACPNPFPPISNGNFAGRDATINVFAGGNINVTGNVAEAEGKIVALGNMTVNKSGGGVYNVGVVGAGSRVPPPDGDDFLTVGGDLTVSAGSRMEVGGSDATTTAWGNVRHGGTSSGTVNFAAPGQLIQDPDAAAPYRSVRTTIEERSSCAAEAAATGTVTTEFGTATFAGDGSSLLQVFNVPGDLVGTGGGMVALSFTGIPASATVLVNMLGSNPVINVNSVFFSGGDPLVDLGARLMWNFPTASTGRITGSAQFAGSILAGDPASTINVSVPGVNGRVYAAGNLTHEGAGGNELHAYPFNGELPVCSTSTPTPTPTATTTTTTPTPTATTTTPTPTPTTESPTPTPTTATPTPTSTTSSATPSESTSSTPASASASPSANGNGHLPDTGSPAWLFGSIAAILIALGALLFTAVSRQTKRRH
ncbi:choice-of-anchor A family protein [Streptacidiphilus sp. N1-3]|uniref:Choice-of-anchor A family protein n=1 Tax=Streptacidiphilus alkalitolerans TaxID=3342712 RepID=A0ABV6WUG2_9ACTN